MRYLYSLLFYILQPVIWLRLLLRSRRAPAYRQRWLERYGFIQNIATPDGILIHAVSVGETLAAVPLVKKLQQDYPALSITLTTMTPTGSELVTKTFGKTVSHYYLPYDLPGSMRRFIQRIQPRLVIIMETELWPNLLQQLHRKNIPIILANARLSARSTRRYQRIIALIRPILQQLTIIAAQTEKDITAFQSLRCSSNQLVLMGNLKFHLNPTPSTSQKIATLQGLFAERTIWIAGSTHRNEEKILIAAHQQLLLSYPTLLLIIVPRHPERFKEVADNIHEANLNFQYLSQSTVVNTTTQVVLGDTMGELRALYSVADIAFIGGSLIEHGGQNPLEATYYGLPILMGSSRFNFSEICRKLEQEQLLFEVDNATSIANKLTTLIENPLQRQDIKQRSERFMQHNQQALSLLMSILKPYLLANQSDQ